jgi:DNA polymerase I-like protein with 3'-5' exonuclease and polymerase domains
MKSLFLILVLISFVTHTIAKDNLELAMAVCLHESGGNPKAFNKKEKAVGAFQIRPIRVRDYNQKLGTNYRLNDFYDFELSLECFLYYARGKTWEQAARSWNGSGPMTVKYWEGIKQKLRKMNANPNSKEAYKLLHDGILALARAERQGIRVDTAAIAEQKIKIEENIAKLEAQFKKTEFYKEWRRSAGGPINIYSGDQLQKFLYDVKGYEPTKKTNTGKGSTDKKALQQLKIPELQFFEDRQVYKKAFDVLNGFEQETFNGFMHPFFNLHIARTFRSSSDSPNFQNIPIRNKEIAKMCRSVLFPRKGHFLAESDFKSIEVGISSCYNQDPTLLEYMRDPTTDMHRDMAMQLYFINKFDENIPSHSHLRKAAKNGFVFPQFYGDYYKNNATSLLVEWGGLEKTKFKPHQGLDLIGWDPPLHKFTLSDHLRKNGIHSFDEYVEHVQKIERDFWENRFPVYAQWKNDWYAEYLKKGYIDTYTGFRCYGPMSKNDATNYPVQGAAFHCLLKCFIKIDKIARKEKWDTKLIGQIHDSMVLDINPDEADHVMKTIRWVTSEWLPRQFKWIIVPVKVDIDVCDVDRPWSEKHKLKEVA